MRVIDTHLAQRGYFCQWQCRYYCRKVLCETGYVLFPPPPSSVLEPTSSVNFNFSVFTSFVSLPQLVYLDTVAGGIDISRLVNEGDRAWNTLYEG